MAKDKMWFKAIKWDNACLKCHKANNNTCPIRRCAEAHYDNNGNVIPKHKEANNV